MSSKPGRVGPFFLLTFAITWGLQVPGVLAQRGLLPGDPRWYLPFAGLGLLGPAVAAVVLAQREGGRAGVKALLAPFAAAGVPLSLALVMLLYFTGASLLLTWMVNGTRGSLLIAVVGHLAAHLNNSHRALPLEVLPLVGHAVIYAALGLLVMRVARPPTAASVYPTRPSPTS
jgi:hypothetical protein